MIRLSMLVWALSLAIPAQATSVRSASLDDLIQMSTSVIRGQVVGSSAAFRGSLIYTHYTIQVLDRWKGGAAAQVDVQIPGGTVSGLQQNVAGAPQLVLGGQYVFFLWTGPSGANYPLGLSQGVLDVSSDAAGNTIVTMQASEALALSPVTSAVASQVSPQMKLTDFGARVSSVLRGGSNTQ